ncbi:hypothetical protein DFH06DRAFT_1305670 [Mycena polygramma]|nr:hypothetical protein DFH06DRAFT_1305670 [Mycena polygramma]
MFSVSDLRARIEELSSAIELQNQVLRDLESSRSKARRDLNAALDPITRLPLEISSHIFQLCVPGSSPQSDFPDETPAPDPSDAPTLFLGVCNSWSSIALSTPSLWTTIHTDLPNATHFETWLSRARSLPVSFISRCTLSFAVISLVKQHAHRMLSLDIVLNSPEELREMMTRFLGSCPPVLVEYTILCALVIVHTRTGGHEPTRFPTLKKLSIRHAGNMFDPWYLELCADALHVAPALVECQFINMYSRGQEIQNTDDDDARTHLSLQHLRLGHPADERWAVMGSSSRLLKAVTLPALETLFIGNFDMLASDFNSFLARSSPPLRSLCILPYDTEIDGAVGSIPTLTDLTIDCGDRPSVLDIMATNQNFLPNLQSLTIHGWFPDVVDEPVLIGMLEARSRQLRSLRVLFNQSEPRESLIEILGEYVKDGMNIHVGSERHNYI